MALAICIDFKSPWSYLAVAPTLALVAELEVEADWLPIAVPALEPPQPETAEDDRGTRHRRFRARYLERDLKRYAEALGLEIEGIYRSPDSSLAGIGLLWTRRRAPEAVRAYLEAVFERYWQQALDIEDRGAICGLLAEIGVATGGLEWYLNGAGRAEHQQLQAALCAAGVFAAPAYLVADELFLGRQHLPMIRWLLESRTGAPPI